MHAEHHPASPGRRLRRVLRLADGADREPPRALGEMDSSGSHRAASAVRRELWTGVLDQQPHEHGKQYDSEDISAIDHDSGIGGNA